LCFIDGDARCNRGEGTTTSTIVAHDYTYNVVATDFIKKDVIEIRRNVPARRIIDPIPSRFSTRITRRASTKGTIESLDSRKVIFGVL
jgi:hypothetical protein